MDNYTFTDAYNYIAEFLRAEGAQPDRSLIVLLYNQALRTISRETRVYGKSWSNAGGGELTLTSATAPLPVDCLEIQRVEWDGPEVELKHRSVEWLDENRPGWREATGDPEFYTTENGNIVLSSIPSAATGKLVARGRAYLPNNSETGTPNPLSYLPAEFQLLPCEYVLGMLPVVTEGKTNLQIAVARDRKRTHAAMWDEQLDQCRGVVVRREMSHV